MKTNVQKWGDELAIRIPKGLADALHLQHGAEVELDVDDARLILTPRREGELDALVSRIDENNRHNETDWGDTTGDEAW